MAPHIENTTQYKKLITQVYFEALKYNKSHICVNKLLKKSYFYVFFTIQEWIICPLVLMHLQLITNLYLIQLEIMLSRIKS
jgi:hypothetical protein